MELACCCLRNLAIILVPSEGGDEGDNDEGKRLPLVTPDMYEQINQFMQLQNKEVHSLKEAFDMLMDTDLKGVEKRGMAGDMLEVQLLVLQKLHPNDPLAEFHLAEFVSIVATWGVANELVTQHRRDFLVHGLLVSVWPCANAKEQEAVRRRGMKRLVLSAIYGELTSGQPALNTIWTNALVEAACYAPAYLPNERAASPEVVRQPLTDSLFSFFRRQGAVDLGSLPTAQLFHEMRQAFTSAEQAIDSSVRQVAVAAANATIDDTVREAVGKAIVVLVNVASTRHIFVNHIKQLTGEGFESMRAKIENQLADQHRQLMLEVFTTPSETGGRLESSLARVRGQAESGSFRGRAREYGRQTRILANKFLRCNRHCSRDVSADFELPGSVACEVAGTP